jgi:uncharacterized protein (TIGR02453 family)
MAISEKSLLFLDENQRKNDREWFNRNKKQYKELVEAPMLAVSEALGPTVSGIDPSLATEPRRTLSRIWRDTRFSKDKTRFKRSTWITFQREKGLSHPVYFFEFSPEFHRYGCGYYATPAVCMAYIRERILENDPLFREARKALEALPHFSIEGETYKRPRYAGQPEDLRAWLERKSVTAVHTSGDRAALFSADLADVMADAFIKLEPVYAFLTHCHVEALKEQEFRLAVKARPF